MIIFMQKTIIGGVIVFVFIVFITYVFIKEKSLFDITVINPKINEDIILKPFDSTDLYISPQIIPKHIFLLVLVSSSPHDREHQQKRDAIRESWGHCHNLHSMYEESKGIKHFVNCKVVFFMGHPKTFDSSIILEAKINNDILMVDHIDKYETITNKLLITLEWASHYKPRYILKSDDDVFIHIPKLISNILMKNNIKYLYGGVLYSGKVVRDKKHRHYISEQLYNISQFPVFCKGALYVFSGSILPSLLDMSHKVKRFGVDDAYIGVLMNSLHVKPVYIKEFITIELKMFLYYLCDCDLIKLIGIGDGLNSEQILRIHERIKYIDQYTFVFPCVHMSFHAVVISIASCFILSLIVWKWEKESCTFRGTVRVQCKKYFV